MFPFDDVIMPAFSWMHGNVAQYLISETNHNPFKETQTAQVQMQVTMH